MAVVTATALAGSTGPTTGIGEAVLGETVPAATVLGEMVSAATILGEMVSAATILGEMVPGENGLTGVSSGPPGVIGPRLAAARRNARPMRRACGAIVRNGG